MGKKRKVLFTKGMTESFMLILTDAPKEAIEEYCVYHNRRMEDEGNFVLFGPLKKKYSVRLLLDSETDSRESLEIIGYDESYDLFNYTDRAAGVRQYAFWKYDCAPFLLGGEVEEILDDGRVRIKDRYRGMTFRPALLLPYEKGLEYQKLLDHAEETYRKETRDALQKCRSISNALLQYQFSSSPAVKREHISQIRSGNCFIVNGVKHTAMHNAHYNTDEDIWIVYDTEGNSFFEEDIDLVLEELWKEPRVAVLFDVDGVLNSMHTPGDLDESSIRILQKICSLGDSRLVLASTWKSCFQDGLSNECIEMAMKLIMHLAECGLQISSMTPETSKGRPADCAAWLEEHKGEYDAFLILDDDYPEESYEKLGLGVGLIHTDFFCNTAEDGGLQEKHMEEALQKIRMQTERRGK